MKTTALLFATFAFALSAHAGPGEKSRTIESQSCWIASTPQVELSLTHLGGHMAPVTFYRDTAQPVRPYYISPWQGEKLDYPAPVLVPLRGDFFCVPFGGNGEVVNGEKHPPHGETAGSLWKHVATKKAGDVTTLTVTLQTKARPGKVTKELSLVDGQNVVYSRDVIEGFAGKGWSYRFTVVGTFDGGIPRAEATATGLVTKTIVHLPEGLALAALCAAKGV